MIESLLTEIASRGWTVSWAFQFSPGHWRVSLLEETPDGDFFRCCADAPTLAEALEDAMSAAAEFHEAAPQAYSLAPKADLLSALGLRKTLTPIKRRI